jgi:hypothetical protein
VTLKTSSSPKRPGTTPDPCAPDCSKYLTDAELDALIAAAPLRPTVVDPPENPAEDYIERMLAMLRN